MVNNSRWVYRGDGSEMSTKITKLKSKFGIIEGYTVGYLVHIGRGSARTMSNI